MKHRLCIEENIYPMDHLLIVGSECYISYASLKSFLFEVEEKESKLEFSIKNISTKENERILA